MRTPAMILAEMKKRFQEGYRVFDFEDDNLTFDRKRIIALCEMVTAEFKGKDIQLLAMNGVSYKSLDEEVLFSMKKAGFTHLNLALVSSNPDTLRAVNRPHNVKRFGRIVEMAYAQRYRITAYQIVGIPDEPVASMIDTMIVLAGLPVLIGISIFYLIPGSSIADLLPRQTDDDVFQARSTVLVHKYGSCSKSELYTLFITARILNFLKGLQLPTTEITIDDLIDCNFNDARERLGLLLLQKLFVEQKLYASTKKGLLEVKEFDRDLFFHLWEKLKKLKTQEGKIITVQLEDK